LFPLLEDTTSKEGVDSIQAKHQKRAFLVGKTSGISSGETN